MSADILPFLKGRFFDADATRAMGEAFDHARRMLHDRGQPTIVQELIARRIIDIDHAPHLARRHRIPMDQADCSRMKAAMHQTR